MKRKELLIGILAVLALAILFFGINFLKGVNIFKAANYFYASYTNVEGLTQSAPVTLNGYKIGIVRDIHYDYNNPGHVIVELSLDNSSAYPKAPKALLPPTSSALLRLHSNRVTPPTDTITSATQS